MLGQIHAPWSRVGGTWRGARRGTRSAASVFTVGSTFCTGVVLMNFPTVVVVPTVVLAAGQSLPTTLVHVFSAAEWVVCFHTSDGI